MTLAQIFNLEKVGDGHDERYESANLTLTHHGLEWEDFEAAASSIRSLPTLAEQLREWAKALEQDGGLATRKGIIDWMREVAADYTGFPDPGSEPSDEPPLKGTGEIVITGPVVDHTPDNRTAPSRTEAESRAWNDFGENPHSVLSVTEIDGFRGEDAVDVQFDEPVLVRVVETPDHDIIRWMDNTDKHLDPVWTVEVVGARPELLEGMQPLWIYGHSYKNCRMGRWVPRGSMRCRAGWSR